MLYSQELTFAQPGFLPGAEAGEGRLVTDKQTLVPTTKEVASQFLWHRCARSPFRVIGTISKEDYEKNHSFEGSLPWNALKTSLNYREDGRQVLPIMLLRWAQIRINICTNSFFSMKQTYFASLCVALECWKTDLWNPKESGPPCYYNRGCFTSGLCGSRR